MTYRQKVEQYCEDVLSGTVLACGMVKKAVERHLADLEKDWAYTFDWEAAEWSCVFFETLLCHSIGADAGKPFVLEPWQAFINYNLFGWKRKSGGRRFRRAHVSVGRKNGKSTWCSGLAIQLSIADDENVAQVFVAATKRDQAMIIFEECTRMLGASHSIGRHATLHKFNIGFDFSRSYIRPLGSDKPFDGLNPHAVFFDELHAWQEHHRKFYDTMVTGSGARSQPFQMTITTAGEDRSLLYLEESNHVRSILDGTIVDEERFGIIFELEPDDDLFDADLYIKANPNLGVSLNRDYLEQQILEARSNPHARQRLKRYHANQLTSAATSAFTVEDWKNAESEPSDWSESLVVTGGLDLGGEDDLAAYGLCAKFAAGLDERGESQYRYELKAKAYIAENTKRDLTQQPFGGWIQSGQLTVAKYVTQAVRDDLVDEIRGLSIPVVAYDPYLTRQLGEELELEGIESVKMPQNYIQFNEPIRTFTQLLKAGLITHHGCPVLVWAAMNAVIIQDRNERYMFDKKSSKDKIDPIVAIIMAYRMASLQQVATGSLFIS